MTTQSIETSAQFVLQRIYAQVSSEVPNAPNVFNLMEAPHVDVKFNIRHKKIEQEPELYEVELSVLVHAIEQPTSASASQKKTIFLIEVKQTGLFMIRGVSEQDSQQIMNVNCPATLYPYATSLVSYLIAQAGFMPLYLPPVVDFNSLYTEQKMSSGSSHDSSD